MKKVLILLLFGIVTMQSFADEITGSCGDNLTWSIKEDTLLTITGSGVMTDYSSWSSTPWMSYRTKIKQINISGGITHLGDNAFNSCTDFHTIHIPNTVTTIGHDAFNFCTALDSVFLPEGLSTIGRSAFSWCSQLKYINFPISLKIIESSTFSNCTSLKSIVLPEKLEEINDYAFSSCTALDSISFPDNVKGLKDGVLSGCSNLTFVNLPNNKELRCGQCLFSGCSNLRKLHISEKIEHIEGLSLIGCGNLDSIIVSESNAHLCSINGVLYNKDKTVIVMYPCGRLQDSYDLDTNVTSIGDYAFYRNTHLNQIALPENVLRIGDNAFNECTNLSNFYFNNTVNNLGKYAFSNTGLLNVEMPNSVNSIGEGLFANCSNLTNVVLSQNITEISNSMFSNCMQMNSVDIPDNVKRIGDNAFSSCGGLKIRFPANLETIGRYVFQFTSLGDVVIPSVKTIDDGAFYYSMLTSIVLPEGLTTIGDEAFSVCLDLTSAQLPNSVKKLGKNCFMRCHSLSSLNLPNDLQIVGEYCISGTAIKELIIPSSLDSVCDYAFAGNLSLKNVIINEGVRYIGNGAFQSNAIKKIVLPSTTTHIGYYSFSAGEGIRTIVCASQTPPELCGSGCFNYHDKTITAYIPTGRMTDYSQTYWNMYNLVERDMNHVVCNINDSINFSNNSSHNYDYICYTRTFNNTSWQALYVPFSMSYDDWKDDFEVAYINGVRQQDTDNDGVIDYQVMDIVKITNGTLKANTPYMIKAKTTGEKVITVNDATLYATAENSIDCSTTVAKYTFTGTYSTIDAATVQSNNYYAMGGGSLRPSTSDLKPFRWYMNIESRDPMVIVSSQAKDNININVIGEEDQTTGVKTFYVDNERNTQLYDIHGRMVSGNYKGLIIKNGKKYINK